MQMIQSWKVFDIAEGCATEQRDLNRVGKQTDRILMKFRRENAKSCMWGGITTCSAAG